MTPKARKIPDFWKREPMEVVVLMLREDSCSDIWGRAGGGGGGSVVVDFVYWSVVSVVCVVCCCCR